MVESIQDLTGLDRDVARAARAVDRFRDELARGPEAGGDSDPFDGLRHTAALSTVRALEAFSPSVADAPLRDALVRWVRALTDARVGVVDDIAVARAMAAPSARYEGEPPRRVTWRQAWRGVVEARTAGHAQMWIMAASGPRLLTQFARAPVDVARWRGGWATATHGSSMSG